MSSLANQVRQLVEASAADVHDPRSIELFTAGDPDCLNAIKPLRYREAWLAAAASVFAQSLFRPAGYCVPTRVRISVGFPFGRRGGSGQHAIGQCWAPECSADGTFEIFVSPAIDDAFRASDILVHELVHATVGLKAGHGVLFRKCAKAIGLAGPMRATIASDQLKAELARLLREFPPYPHKALRPGNIDGGGDGDFGGGSRKQGTRLMKILCPACGWTGRTTRMWIASGLPTCHCGRQMVAPQR